MSKTESVSTDNFDMNQFMQYLTDNSDRIAILKLERVDCIACCEVKFKEIEENEV